MMTGSLMLNTRLVLNVRLIIEIKHGISVFYDDQDLSMNCKAISYLKSFNIDKKLKKC
jgi:hypothetical protein